MKSRRRPPLPSSLIWFLPALVMVAVAGLAAHPLMLIPLLVANALAMGAVCHAIGFDPEPSFGRTVLRRGAAHLVLFTAYTALVLLLVAWPLVALSATPSLGAVVLLSIALAVALAVLWRVWPAFGLVFVWDDAFAESDERSWIFTAVARSVTFARHLSAEERFFTHFLPAAACLLLLAFGALVLSGLYGVLPSELRTAALVLYALVLLPLCCLVIANRTLRALLCEARGARRAPPGPGDGGSPRGHPGGLGDAPALSPHETAPGAREQGLLAAARQGDVARALALLDAGADADTAPEVGDADQRSVLMLAAQQPATRLLRALIAHGADLNRRHGAMSVLLATARAGCQGRAETVMTLLANGADVTAVDSEGNTALHYIARSDELGIAAMLLDAETPLDALNRHGESPLAVACRAGNWPMAELLLQHRSPLAGEGAEPALVAAAGIAADDPRGVGMLLKHKARVDARNALGRTALMAAALEGHRGIVDALLAARADVDLADAHGTTALMEAARAGAHDVVGALCDAGASPQPRDRHGRDALTLACLSPHVRAASVRRLLEAGADPAATGSDGRSALQCAAAGGRWDLVAVLDPDMPLPSSVAAGAEPDPEADTPDHLLDALRFGHWAIVGSFETRVRSWASSELARLYLALAASETGDDSGRQARRWLLAHGLPCEARLDDGERLFDALLEHLPQAAAATRDLLDAGASPAGAGRLAAAMLPLRAHAAVGVPLVQRMLDGGADACGALADGRTPLHLAGAPGWQSLQQRLLDAGCDPNARDDDGRAPLHAALGHGGDALAAIRALVGAGADPEAAAANGETPLGLALAQDAPSLERWLRWSEWPLPRRRLRDTDLPAAAAAGDVDAVGKLLELGCAVDTPDAKGASALLHACGQGHEAVVVRLLDAGADIALRSASGMTPLAAASCARRGAVVRVLLERNAPVDQRLADDTTALMLACALGHADVAELLAEAGADVDAADAQGRTALHVAAQYCFAHNDSLRARRLLDVLLQRGADLDRADREGMPPLLLLLGAHAKPGAACDATHLGALLPLLLDAGARHDQADQRGVTALHACAMHVMLAPARLLLARGADRAAVDNFGRSPADVARLLGYVDLAAELGGHRAAPGAQQTLRQPAD
ncbi:MAG TPA: ankyrin repeat domain-containing protein [Rhodanobacteraceae bacterium]|nr:ankyrin repeat domain-containing protein [Rhodanobacteraceae bacterium]